MVKAEIRKFGGARLLYGEYAGSWSLGWRAESQAPRPTVEVFPGQLLLDNSRGHYVKGYAQFEFPPEPFQKAVMAEVNDEDIVTLDLDASPEVLSRLLLPDADFRREGDSLLLTGRFADGVLRVSGTIAFRWRPEEGAGWERADLCVGYRGTAVDRPDNPGGRTS